MIFLFEAETVPGISYHPVLMQLLCKREKIGTIDGCVVALNVFCPLGVEANFVNSLHSCVENISGGYKA
jgi:hypothetical protein